MTLRQYLTIMILATLMCWVSWVVVLLNIDPFAGSSIGFLFFYVSLFFSLVGTVSLLTLLAYKCIPAFDSPIHVSVRRSFRDGIAVAGIVIALLYLLSHRLLNIWNFGVFVIVVALIIVFSLTTKSKTPRTPASGTGPIFHH